MTLPTGSIAMDQVAAELGISQTGLNLNHGWVRSLAGENSGAVDMNSLRGQTAQPTFSGNPGSGPVLVLNMSVPFFRGTTSSVGWNGVPGNPTVLSFSAAPNWTGNILFKNLTTGQSVVLNYQNSTTWQGSGNILRSNTTDSFLLAPST
ncbi:MAG TPA: hypothetical protein VJ840_18810 [Gemmatimonadaceae bacterium]|nr:hypothetical protein [Gemmatimonadaceae bacterium]